MCKTRSFFRQVPIEYDINDDELYHEFKKCMFAKRIRSGLYVFRNRENGDHMYYRITNKSYDGSYGVYNGSPIRIMMDK
jgi:hypothetical protein